MPALTTGAPMGALDLNYLPKQSPMVDERDPFAMARDKRQQQIIENQNEIDRLKGNKWAQVGRMLQAAGAGFSGRDPSTAYRDFNAQVSALQNQNAQLNAGIEDLSLQEAMMRMKMQQTATQRGGSVGSPQRLDNGNLGIVVDDGQGNYAVRDLGVAYDRNKIQLINGVPHAITPEGAVPLMSGDQFRSTAQQGADAKELESTASTRGSKIEARNQGYIDGGMNAVDALPETMRAMDLLDEVSTGGFSSAAIKAKKMFGYEAADEGELDYLLSKSVLSQLKQTFGAAFTKDEAKRLEDIEAGLSRNPESNRRILDQGLSKWDRALKRAHIAAEKAGDPIALAEIEEAMDLLTTWREEREQRKQAGGQDKPADIQRDPVEQQADQQGSGFKIISVE